MGEGRTPSRDVHEPPTRVDDVVTAAERPERAGWEVPWGIGDVVAVFFVTALLTVLAAFGLAVLIGAGVLSQQASVVLLPLPLILLAATTVGWVGWRHGEVRRLAGPARGAAKEWLVGLGAGAAAFIGINVVLGILLQIIAGLAGFELPQPQEGLRDAATEAGLLPWVAVSAIVVAPITEELYFRGMIFPALRRRMRTWPAILVSAVVFGLAHLFQEATGPSSAVAFVMILPMGVFLAWLYNRRGNVAAPIAAHAVFNAVAIALLAVDFDMPQSLLLPFG